MARALNKNGLERIIRMIEEDYLTQKERIMYLDAIRLFAIIDRGKAQFGKRMSIEDYDDKIKKYNMEQEMMMKHNCKLSLYNYRKRLSTYYKEREGKNISQIIHAKKKPTIRATFEQYAKDIQKIKPVVMMSPFSIPKYIPTKSVKFDIVIFDEASQLMPHNALGAILRGKQVVVIGDEKQLPPTNFFQKELQEDFGNYSEKEEINNLKYESVLDLFLSKRAKAKMLRWHYRSKHQSLIHVSNHEFYNANLIIFPSKFPPHNKETGLIFHHTKKSFYVPGRDGGRASNPREAQIISEKVKDFFTKHRASGKTLGVVAFSKAQKDEINFHLDKIKKEDRFLEKFLDPQTKNYCFVKNLETVQGDERDVIFVSVGYGMREDGKMSMRFGPINHTGGEKRLNVAMTRAREKCELFCNFQHIDIAPTKKMAEGVRVLKQFLKYAKTRKLEFPTKSRPDQEMNPFEYQVYLEIEKMGYRADSQVGSSGFFIDLAVLNPESPSSYLLGVECDGATYHSGSWRRERDRIRENILRESGWKIHRIWSTDWFYSKESEIERLKTAIQNQVGSLDKDNYQALGENTL